MNKTGGCWVWQGYVQNAGYGSMSTYIKTQLAHRWAFEYFREPIPKGMTVDHLCRNKLCVNPEHLELVTRTQNIQRAGLAGVARREAIKTHCPKGHSYKDFGVKTKNGYTNYGTTKYARRCTICYPKYLK